MERHPQHREQDSTLRASHIEQVSYDEYLLSAHPELLEPESTFRIAAGIAAMHPTGRTPGEVAQDMRTYAAEEYARTLYPDTTLNEILYLQGNTDIADRAVLINQWNLEHSGTDKVVPRIDY